MSARDPKEAALEAALTAIGVASGSVSPADGARRLLALGVDMIPVDELKKFLTDRDRIFADLSADMAEQVKLDGRDKR